ncbi:MAG TPA: hypothetical protein DEG90_05065 [Porphyromonadaceae bacterium]|nr:hypothetical protein [Porphyromonadaceae bacterium]
MYNFSHRGFPILPQNNKRKPTIMNDNFISEIDDHLSYIIDMLSAISANAYVIKNVAGTVEWHSKTGKKASVAQMTTSQNRCVSLADERISKIRKILKEHGDTNL